MLNPREIVMYEMLHAIAEAAKVSPSTPLNKIFVVHHDNPHHLECKTVRLDVDVPTFLEALEADFA